MTVSECRVVEVHQHPQCRTEGPRSSKEENDDDACGSCVADSTPSYAALTQMIAEEWDFTPYPSCSLKQLRQVHTYWVALGTHEDPAEQTASPGEELSGGDEALPQRQEAVMGVVGVVWVKLSGGGPRFHQRPNDKTANNNNDNNSNASVDGPPVEGYLQVVLVPAAHRRGGIAGRLLRCCLGAEWAIMDGRSKSCIERWRLHTMLRSADTEKYLLRGYRYLMEEEEGENVGPAAAEAVPASDPRCSVEERCAQAMAMLHAVVEHYEKLGFRERRCVYKYYDGGADAVEMVKAVPAARKSQRR